MTMKRLAAAALGIFFIAFPVCAQRSSGHSGGFSSHSGPAFHSAPAFHGSFNAPTPSRSAGFRGYPANRPYIASRGIQRYGANNYGARPFYNGDLRHRRPYRSPYGILGYGGYGYPGWIDPGYLGYDDSGDDDSQPAQDDANGPQQDVNGGYDQGPDQGPGPGYDQGPYQQQFQPWPYGGSAQPAPVYAQPAPPAPNQVAVTLIFKDGRPPEQIHNYLLTKNTLFIDDQHHQEIPVDELDLAATAKVNRDSGVDFHLPTLPGS